MYVDLGSSDCNGDVSHRTSEVTNHANIFSLNSIPREVSNLAYQFEGSDHILIISSRFLSGSIVLSDLLLLQEHKEPNEDFFTKGYQYDTYWLTIRLCI